MNSLLATKKLSKRGFSLLELSVVIIIVGVLILSTLKFGQGQVEAARLSQTKSKLDKIQTAILAYYKINGSLPCPADGTQPLSSASFGAENKKGTGANTLTLNNVTCNSSNLITNGNDPNFPDAYIGVLPTAALNLPPDFMFDGWNNRITYVVSRFCISPVNWQYGGNKFACNSDGVTSGNTADTTDGEYLSIRGVNTAYWPTYAPYVIISHGSNGIGSWNQSGSARASGSTSPAEEVNGNLAVPSGVFLNPLATSGYIIYYDYPINDLTPGSTSYFDDIIRWSTAPQIVYNASH